MLRSLASDMDAHTATVRPVGTILYVPKKKFSSEGSLGYKFLNISSTERTHICKDLSYGLLSKKSIKVSQPFCKKYEK